ncbi:hypothetical protein [Alteribacillus sp. HJP-4]|uniref:hypothetical protein n=1 Tax=Alteribacillus sp. HJP-4 TaxID=2775394 RepID=UPI0035CCE53C
MLNKAHQGSKAEIVASVLACTWSNIVLVQALNENEEASDHVGTWLTTRKCGWRNRIY